MNYFENDISISSVFGMCVEVIKEHLDVWNHTNNVRYVQWMQDVAVEHSVALGWDSQHYLQAGAIWVVRSHKIDYRKSTHLGDKLLVQTWVSEMKKASCVRRYRFIELPKDCDLNSIATSYRFTKYEDGFFPSSALVATAETHWAFLSTSNFRPVRLFPELISDFETSIEKASKFSELPVIWS